MIAIRVVYVVVLAAGLLAIYGAPAEATADPIVTAENARAASDQRLLVQAVAMTSEYERARAMRTETEAVTQAADKVQDDRVAKFLEGRTGKSTWKKDNEVYYIKPDPEQVQDACNSNAGTSGLPAADCSAWVRPSIMSRVVTYMSIPGVGAHALYSVRHVAWDIRSMRCCRVIVHDDQRECDGGLLCGRGHV